MEARWEALITNHPIGVGLGGCEYYIMKVMRVIIEKMEQKKTGGSRQ